MVTYVVWVVLSIVLALAVFLVASVMERRDLTGEATSVGAGEFWRHFWSGLRHGVRRSRPVDTDMDAFFAATVESAPGYVDADELTDVLQRAREQARHTLHVGHHGAPGLAGSVGGVGLASAAAPAGPASAAAGRVGPAGPAGRTRPVEAAGEPVRKSA